jgi:hypothetical protein
VLLEPLKVVVRARLRSLEREGFYRRLEFGFGHLFGPADLDDWRGSLTSNLVERIPGLQHYADGTIRMLFPLNAPALSTVGLTWCVPTVFVNGLPDPVVVGHLNTYHPSALEGVEVYRTLLEVPGKYRVRMYPSRLKCGVILLWVRDELLIREPRRMRVP